jgi:peroxiredoxin
MKRRNVLVTVAALGALAMAGLYTSYFKDTPAPQVVFTSIQGEKVGTADLRGKVVLVNFWATDCPVCVKEMPRLVQTYQSYGPKGLELIAVAMRYDPPNYVLDYSEKNKLPFKVALDPMGNLAKAFDGVELTPTTVVIDKRGKVVRRILGEPDFGKLEKLIEQKLAEAV